MNKISLFSVMCGLAFIVASGGCCKMKNCQQHHVGAKPMTIELKDDKSYQPLLRGTPQTCGMRSGRVYLEPGQDCGEHTTGAHEEMLVFLAGTGTAFMESGTQYTVGYNKIAYVAPFTKHNIKNTGTSPLIYIYCVSPINGSVSGDDHHQH